jgi:hypothetical protein
MTEEYKGYTIRIQPDTYPENPREAWDNATTMVCFHGRYQLGDKHTYRSQDYGGWDSLRKALEADGAVVVYPLYLYDHSGITISTTPFSCPWDSGQVGWTFMTREQMKECFGEFKRITPTLRKRAESHIEAEVDTYDRYIKGDIWEYYIEKDGEFVDSCSGYYEDINYVLGEAKSVIDTYE